MSNKRIVNITGWAVFAISFIVYLLSVQRTGSLWDCGEFILGAHKLQVVHPPGAPLFLLIGRLFAWAGDVLSDDPAHIAFSRKYPQWTLYCFCCHVYRLDYHDIGKTGFY